MSALLEIDCDRGYRAASKLANSLTEIWSRNGDVDAWEIVGNIFEVSWKMVRNDYIPDNASKQEITTLDACEWQDPVDLQVYS